MKTYVLTVSKTFPVTHKQKGQPTYFPEKILKLLCPFNVQLCEEFGIDLIPKIHTIRANYDLWSKRIKEVQEGNAILSIRYWSGKPYNSKQVEICQLDKDSGVGVQKISFGFAGMPFGNFSLFIDGDTYPTVIMVARNDGLSLEDFKAWFKGYDLSKAMAIIHFTKFRY